MAIFKEKIGALLRELQPDIIDLENETFNAGSAQIVYLRNRYSPKSRIVMHASQSDFKKYPLPFNWFERYSLRNVSGFMARNQDAVDVVRTKGYKGRVEIVTHGVDPLQFTWKQDAAKSALGLSNEFVIGYIGTLGEHKGLDTLVRAVAPLQCKLLLVGHGPYRNEIIRLSKELGLGNKLEIVPPIPHREVPKYLAAMDTFVLPSRTMPNWREKFGRVLIEAMAAGVPIVGSDSGEIPHVIGDAGLVFPEGNVEQLELHLKNLIENPDTRSSLTQKGRIRVNTHYSWEVIAKKTHALYQEVLEES